MDHFDMWHMGSGLGWFYLIPALFLPLILLSLLWKGLVLWLTAKRNEPGWFTFFLLINTLGLGEIIYLFMTDGFKELNFSVDQRRRTDNRKLDK